VSVIASDDAGNTAINESTSYTATTSDKTAPVINSVSLSSTTPETGDSITVTVDVTDNVGVSSVTASGVSLVNKGGNIWEGSIVAEEGTHTVSVTASDVAGNSAVDESASYTATTTSTAVDPVCHMTVNKSTAKFTSVYNGKTYYFCSASCKETFDANPASFL
jgi:YHS domain-containing protein